MYRVKLTFLYSLHKILYLKMISWSLSSVTLIP